MARFINRACGSPPGLRAAAGIFASISLVLLLALPAVVKALDSDSDGIDDVAEGSTAVPPTDTDSDGTPDYLDTDSDNDSVPDGYEVGINPNSPLDIDGDGTPDYQDANSLGVADLNLDGTLTVADFFWLQQTLMQQRTLSAPQFLQADVHPFGGDGQLNISDLLVHERIDNIQLIQTDTDADGMLDSWEIFYGLNPADPDDAAGDIDSDGESNLDEFLAGTDPNVADTEAVTLGSDWHPDPDDDGITDTDNCRHVYNPVQADSDSNGTGDACDPDFAPPTLNGPVTDLRAEHVTPYGAWFSFTSPQSAQYGWQGIIAWTTNITETQSLAGVQAMIDRGDSISQEVHEKFDWPLAEPYIITSMDSDTDYYAVVVEEAWDGLTGSASNVVTLRTQPAPQPSVGGSHPRVFATSNLINDLRTRYTAGDATWQAWADSLGARSLQAANSPGSVYNSHYFCGVAALLYQVTDDNQYLTAARTLLDQNLVVWEGGIMTPLNWIFEDSQLGICVDFLWDELATAEKERAVLAMLHQDEYKAANHIPDPHDSDDTAGLARTLLVDGLTGCGETELTTDTANRSCAIMETGLRAWYGFELPKARRTRGYFAMSGGTLPEGTFYEGATRGYWNQTLWVLHNAGDPVDDYAPYLREQLLSSSIHALTPAEGGVFTMGDIEGYSNAEPNSYQFTNLNQQNYAWSRGLLEISGMDEAAGWAQFILNRHFPPSYTYERSLPILLFSTESLPEVDYRGVAPLANLDSGVDIFLDRTSWSTDASQLLFMAGWSGIDHNHADAGHFQLYRRGAWMTHEPFGYQGPIAAGGGHSTLQLQVHDSSAQYSYEGAQTQEILRASTNSVHSYVAADLGGAYKSAYYNSDNYDLVQRSLVWLKSDESSTADSVIIFDQVHNKPAVTGLSRKLRFHIDTLPQISGRIATSNTGLGTISQQVEIAAVLPTSSTLQYLAPVPGATPGIYPGNYHTHRVDIDPGTANEQIVFVSVLRASNASGFAAMNPLEVETAQLAGVVIDTEAVLFTKDDLRTTPAGADLIFDLPASVDRVWLAGLSTATSYSVQLTDNGATTGLTISLAAGIDTDEGGLLGFDISSGVASPIYGP